MRSYSAYVLDRTGHVTRRIDLTCLDDETAKEQAIALVDEAAIELWEGARFIAEFKPAIGSAC
ncbi:hypothetical protein ACQPTN_24140 [Bradyrhizobium sp. 13971]